MKTPQEYVNEFFGEIQFVSCPTETKEPFFWKWTNDGKEIIESFLLTSLKEYRKQCAEITPRDVGMLRQWLNEDIITDPKKMVTNEDLIHFINTARQSDNK